MAPERPAEILSGRGTYTIMMPYTATDPSMAKSLPHVGRNGPPHPPMGPARGDLATPRHAAAQKLRGGHGPPGGSRAGRGQTRPRLL